MNQQQVSPIVRYAQLKLAQERYQAIGHPVPGQVISEIQDLESWAQANFPPQTIQKMLGMVEQAKVRVLEQERHDVQRNQEFTDQRAAALRQMNTDTLARRIGNQAGIDVRNAEEFHRVLRGMKLKRGNPRPTRVEPQTLDEATKEATKHLDLNGEGFTAKQWKDKLDWLWEYHGTHQWENKVRAAGLRKPKALKDAMTRFQQEEIVGRLSPEPHKVDPVHEVKPSDSDTRRAFIAKEVMKGLVKEGTEREMDEFQRPGLYKYAREIVEDKYGYEKVDSRRQDIAKAVLEHWPEDDSSPEVEYDYSDDPTPDGDVDEDEED